MPEKFPNLGKETEIQVQETHTESDKRYTLRDSHGDILYLKWKN